MMRTLRQRLAKRILAMRIWRKRARRKSKDLSANRNERRTVYPLW